jgi:long-chain fatty acid transport protein
VVLGLGLWLASGARPALAAGFAVTRFGGEHGHPTTDNATALYYNPAGLSASRGTHVFFDALLAYRKLTYTRFRHPSDVPEPADAAGANTGRGELLDALASPALAVTHRLGPVVLGAGFFTPFGGFNRFQERAEFADHPRYAGPVDGVNRWHSIEGLNVTSYGALGAAYRLPGTRLSLGLAANVMLSVLEDLRAWSADGNGLEGEGRSLLEARGIAFGFGAGLLYEALPRRLWLGASYQSRPNLGGEQRLHGSLQNDIGGPSSAEVDVLSDLPDVIRWGLRYRPRRRLELRLFGDVTRWSAFEHQCVLLAGRDCRLEADGSQPSGGAVLQNIPRQWRDSFDARAGLSVWTSSILEVMTGIGYGSSAVPDRTLEAGMPDFENVSFSLGGRVRITPKTFMALSYTQMLFVPRQVESGLSSYAVPTRSPDAGGHYAQSVGYCDINLDVQF